MSELLRPITALLLSAAILLMGNGLLTILVPLRAELQVFLPLEIGVLGAAYYAGLFAGCILCPPAVARVGHVRSFTAFTALATIIPLLQAIFIEPIAWWFLRLLSGICFAGMTMVIESWLNGATDNRTRGSVFSFYTVLNLTVVAVGQMLIGVGDPKDFQLFSLVAILMSLAAVPVSLSRAVAPAPPERARLRLLWLYRLSPVAVAGCLVNGLTNGAFWSLAPVFATRAGLPSTAVAVFMSVAVIGGALVQWPAGYLSDRIDRRRVILGVTAASALAGALLAAGAGSWGTGVIMALGFAYGGAAIPIYAISVAHANDFATREDSVDVSSGLLLTYAAGAVIGPLIASAGMNLWNAGMLFVFTAAIHSAFSLFVVLRIRAGRTAPAETRDEFVAVPRTTQAVFALDPRTPESEAPTGEGARGG